VTRMQDKSGAALRLDERPGARRATSAAEPTNPAARVRPGSLHRWLSDQFVDVTLPAVGFTGFFAGAAVAAVSTGVDDTCAVVGFGMIVEQRSWNSALALVS